MIFFTESSILSFYRLPKLCYALYIRPKARLTPILIKREKPFHDLLSTHRMRREMQSFCCMMKYSTVSRIMYMVMKMKLHNNISKQYPKFIK